MSISQIKAMAAVLERSGAQTLQPCWVLNNCYIVESVANSDDHQDSIGTIFECSKVQKFPYQGCNPNWTMTSEQ